MKHESIDKLRASNSPCLSGEWEAILTAVLYNSEAQKGVEAVAKIHDDRLVDIVIRRRVEGINVNCLAKVTPADADVAYSKNLAP